MACREVMCIIVYVVKNVSFSSGLIWYIQLSSLFQFEVYDTIFASISVLRSRCRSCIGKPIYLVCRQLQLYRLFEFVNSSVPAVKHRHISCLIVNVWSHLCNRLLPRIIRLFICTPFYYFFVTESKIDRF